MRPARLALLACLASAPALAGGADLPRQPPAPFAPDASQAPAPETDTWIFSGVLGGSGETFSGTLVTGRNEPQFELRLANGTTCDGGSLKPETGLVRLSDITCSDDRVLRTLFVPQGGELLKVFGHVGDERFSTVAHLLGTKPPVVPSTSAAPHAPLPGPPGAPPPGSAPRRGTIDPG